MITTTTRAMNLVSKAKTAEIMSKYRPIAPRPELNPDGIDKDEESQKIKRSPYLQRVWAHLQARPTRTQKRGRTSLAPPAIKRHRTAQFLPVYTDGVSGAFGLCKGLDKLPIPIMPCPVLSLGRDQGCMGERQGEEGIDLNRIPEERDFIWLLQGPVSPSVIAPQPIRPVGSSINVRCINEEQKALAPSPQIPKKKHEVEDDVEFEALPAVVSDTNNKVRLANSAYKEMVGQPECSWLDTMAQNNGKVTRICGEVMLQFPHQAREELLASNGFSCWVDIQWGRPNEKNCSVHVFCDVIKLFCESKDYAFEWKFHICEAKY